MAMKPPKAAAPPPPPAAFEMPRFHWGSTRLLRCQLPSSSETPTEIKNDSDSDRPSLVFRLPVPPAAAKEPHRPAPPPPELPWGLRSRSANPNKKPLPSDSPPKASVGDGEEKGVITKKERRKPAANEFRLKLTKEEIEADFIALTGSKPSRRPNHRRTRTAQNYFDSLSPGSSLPKTVAPDRYEVLKPSR